MPTLLDTDILSAIMRRETLAIARSIDYLAAHPQLSISIITRYEVLRGLKAKNAQTQLAQPEILCRSLQIFPSTTRLSCAPPTSTPRCVKPDN